MVVNKSNRDKETLDEGTSTDVKGTLIFTDVVVNSD